MAEKYHHRLKRGDRAAWYVAVLAQLPGISEAYVYVEKVLRGIALAIASCTAVAHSIISAKV